MVRSDYGSDYEFGPEKWEIGTACRSECCLARLLQSDCCSDCRTARLIHSE